MGVRTRKWGKMMWHRTESRRLYIASQNSTEAMMSVHRRKNNNMTLVIMALYIKFRSFHP